MSQTSAFLELNASQHGDEIALVFDGDEISWKELDRRATRLAAGLQAAGLSKGDVVAYHLRNCTELVVLWWAIQKAGMVALPLNVRLTAREILSILHVSQCRALFYAVGDEGGGEMGAIGLECPSLKMRVVVGGGDACDRRPKGLWRYDDLAIDEAFFQAIEIGECDGSLLLFTSGTTGAPKGVLRSQQVVRDYALMMAIENENASVREVLLTLCPLFHTAGMSLLMKMAALGGMLVLHDGFNAEKILDDIEAYHATQMLLIPPSLYLRLAEAPLEGRDLSSVREAQCSGGKVSAKDVEAMHELFPRAAFKFSWGSTETCAPTSARITYDDLQRKPELVHTVGTLNNMVDMVLVDEWGKPVAPGEVGEAWVRSSMCLSGYLGDEERTAEAFTEDGWFRTADLLRCDEEGYYYLVDRRSDMIKSGGENVYALEVERALAAHPRIRECAVFGVADARLTEAVAAAVVTIDGSPLDGEELLRYCRGCMASYKKPRYVVYLPELPRNSIGKLQKSVLRSLPSEDLIALC